MFTKDDDEFRRPKIMSVRFELGSGRCQWFRQLFRIMYEDEEIGK